MKKQEFDYPFKKLVDNWKVIGCVSLITACVVGMVLLFWYLDDIIAWLP